MIPRYSRPQMVETYSKSPDGLLYRFTLRSGLKFHDGSPVTARDAVATLRRLLVRDTQNQILAGLLVAGSTVLAHAETPVERGEYLVRGPAGCGNCHTPMGPDGFVANQELGGRLVEDGEAFTDEGLYTITVENQYTKAATSKRRAGLSA